MSSLLEQIKVRLTFGRALVLLIPFVLAVGFLAWGDLPVLMVTDVVRDGDATLLMAGLTALFFSFYARGLRWLWLLPPEPRVSGAEVVSVNGVFYCANFFLPFRLGEAVRPLLFVRRGHGGLAENLGLIAWERVFDTACAAVLLGIGLLSPALAEGNHVSLGHLEVDRAVIRNSALVVLVAAACLVLALPLVLALRKQLEGLLRLLPHKVRLPVLALSEKLYQSLEFLKHPGRLIPFLATTLIYWAMVAGCVLFFMHAARLPGDWPEACLVSGLLVFALSVPTLPAQVGVHHAASYVALLSCFPSDVVKQDGGIFVGAFYFSQLFVCSLWGLLGFLWLNLRSGDHSSKVIAR